MTVPHHETEILSLSDPHFSPIYMHCPESHIHQLPVELLQQIFLLIVNDISDCPSIFKFIKTRVSGNFASPPLVFTRVCRLWRDVAHSTTGLWSRIQVTLPSGDEPLKPFLSSLLQSWLARSGSQPLTLRIDRIELTCRLIESRPVIQLLEILQSESMRWETVVGVLYGHEWPCSKLDTPQLRTLECAWSGLSRFNAPNLHRLRMLSQSVGINNSLVSTCKNVPHLHFQYASPKIIRFISVAFPLLETLVVAQVIGCYDDAKSHSVTHSCLESLTLPLPLDDDYYSHQLTEIFDGLRLPALRKLTLVGYPTKLRVDRTMAALAVIATCNLQVIDFQSAMPQDEVDVDVVEPLLSFAREISFRSVLLRCRAPHN
jgi:hypothetical protein